MGGGRRLYGKQSVAQPWSPVDSFLRDRSLVRLPVPADGNCQFHSIALHTHLDHIGVRSAVINFLTLHPHMFAQFIVNESVDSWLLRMSRPSAWGNHITLMAAARIFDYSLPPTAGLLVRPILLCQEVICNELSEAATRFHTGDWENSSQWHSAWIPMYDGNRPEPLWCPREPD